jgi:hypothetical protein
MIADTTFAQSRVLDQVVSFSTFVGQNGSDFGADIATDREGNVYITGTVRNSPNPVQSGEDENKDIFVAKLTADGSELLYLTYVGGSDDDIANAICVDPSGNAIVTGSTRSTDFPVLAAIQENYGGKLDAFLVQLSSDGALIYSSYFGGANDEEAKGIACDGTGNVIITGQTNSPDFPLHGAFQPDLNPAARDAFVTKINIPGSIVYSTYLGGTLLDVGHAVAIDDAGNAFITGLTGSPDFPLVNPLQAIKGGHSPSSPDAFVAKISADGSELVYSTFLGGNLADRGNGIAVDDYGNAYVIGSTFSSDFPTANASQSSHLGNLEVFVAKISAGGSVLDFSSFLGGTGSDSGSDIAIDQAGNIHVVGSTESSDFPMVSAFQADYAGGARDVFVSKLSSQGVLLSSSFFGGGLFDEATGISVGGDEGAYITGRTSSAFLPVENALQPTYGGGSFDPFVAKIIESECEERDHPGQGKCK